MEIKLYRGIIDKIKRIGSLATVGLVLATPVKAAKAENTVTASATDDAIITTTEPSFEDQLMDRGIFVNSADILAYRFLLNIESIAATVEKTGSLPEEYATLDLEALDFDSLITMANRINDAIGNTAFDSEIETILPTALLDNPDQGHVKFIQSASNCVEILAARSMECWFNGTSLADDADACQAIDAFMKLSLQARNYLTAGEYDIAWMGYIQNIGGYILADGGLMNKYLDSFMALSAGDYSVQQVNGEYSILSYYGRTAVLTDNIRQNLGYAENCITR